MTDDIQNSSQSRVISPDNAEHYIWGGVCDGWYFIKNEALNVIQERMPPGTSESRHFHIKSRQFAYVLQGELTIEVESQDYLIKAGEGLEIGPGREHQVVNRSAHDVHFLMISQPPSHGDRVESKV